MQPNQPKSAKLYLSSPLFQRARHHFGTIVAAVTALRSVLADVQYRMKDLAGQYRVAVGRCKLALYQKKTRDGQPRALYWGRTFKLETPAGVRHVVRHLAGRLTARRIYTISLRDPEKAFFRLYDRRRKPLNAEHARVAKALGRIGQMLALTRIASGRAPLTSPAHESDPLLDRARRLAWACAAVEHDMAQLARRHDPALDVSPIFPYATTTKHGYVAMGWGLPEQYVRDFRVRRGRRHVATRLDIGLLRTLRVPRSVWPALRAIDRDMRRLRLEHARYAKVLGRVRVLRRAAEPRRSKECA